MESAKNAGRNTFRRRFEACAKTLRRWSLKVLRSALDRADEWVHAQEVKLRQEAAIQEFKAEVDPTASRKRELALKEIAGVSADGCTSVPVLRDKTTGARRRLSSAGMAPRRQFPRLRYQGGQFVRSGS